MREFNRDWRAAVDDKRVFLAAPFAAERHLQLILAGPRRGNLPAHLIAVVGERPEEAVFVNRQRVFLAFRRLDLAIGHVHNPAAKTAVISGRFPDGFCHRDLYGFTAFEQTIIGAKGQRVFTGGAKPGAGFGFIRRADMGLRVAAVAPAHLNVAIRQPVIAPARAELHALVLAGGERFHQRDFRRLIRLGVLHANHIRRR